MNNRSATALTLIPTLTNITDVTMLPCSSIYVAALASRVKVTEFMRAKLPSQVTNSVRTRQISRADVRDLSAQQTEAGDR